MKLFLASLAHQTLDLVIPLLPDKPRNLKLAFITTAADPYPADARPWLDADRAKLVGMGFLITDYDLKNKNVESLQSELFEYQVIFVSGGNTYYLLNEVKKSGFDIVIKELIDKGVVYIGSSAGSCIMCPTIEHVELVEHKEVVPELADYCGIGLVKELLMPHAGREKYASRHAKMREIWGDKITFLTDDQAVIVNDGETKIVTN